MIVLFLDMIIDIMFNEEIKKRKINAHNAEALVTEKGRRSESRESKDPATPGKLRRK